MNMGYNSDLAREQILQARHLLWRYVMFLVIVYIGFVVMTELLPSNELFNDSAFFIEVVLVAAILSIVAFAIIKLVKAVSLFKRDKQNDLS